MKAMQIPCQGMLFLYLISAVTYNIDKTILDLLNTSLYFPILKWKIIDKWLEDPLTAVSLLDADPNTKAAFFTSLSIQHRRNGRRDVYRWVYSSGRCFPKRLAFAA